jgi:flagellar hook-associated protein 3 FlgL
MRVTQFSIIEPYKKNLEEIQNRRFKNQVRMSTGKDIVGLGDSPDRIPDIKKLSTLVTQNNDYLSILDDQLNQFQHTEVALQGISDNMEKIRQLAIDGTQVGNMGNLSVLANYVKGIITDIIRNANTDYNGSFVFAGTKTKASSFDSNLPNTNDMPFELIQGTPTQDNPSGLKVVFKGNQETKFINKDQKTSELVNTTSEEIFGQNGIEAFSYLINLYNILAFKQDGQPRMPQDVLTIDEVNLLNKEQSKIAEFSDRINQITARNGGRANRLQLLHDQINEENTRISEYLSKKQDTDFAKTSLELSKDEYALQYALQIGGRTLQNSLFDFLK